MEGILIRLLKKNLTGLTMPRFLDELHNHSRKEVVGTLNDLVRKKVVEMHTINDKETGRFMGLRLGSELYLLTNKLNYKG